MHYNLGSNINVYYGGKHYDENSELTYISLAYTD